jgi:hypothetical protein
MSSLALSARVLVGALFVVHGIAFVWQSPKLRLGIEDSDAPLTPKQARCLGAAEVAGGLVVLLMPPFGGPSALIGAADFGMACVLILATGVHMRAKEVAPAVVTLGFLGLLAIAILWSH